MISPTEAINRKTQTYELIPVALEDLEEALNEPLPEVMPIDEDSCEFQPLQEVKETGSCINVLSGSTSTQDSTISDISKQKSSHSVPKLLDPVPANIIESDSESKLYNSSNGVCDNVNTLMITPAKKIVKENTPKVFSNKLNEKSSRLRHNDEINLARHVTNQTPAKNSRAVLPILDIPEESELNEIQKNIDSNLDLGIEPLSSKTPNKFSKTDKENLWNPPPKPQLHYIRNQHIPLSVKTPIMNPAYKLNVTPVAKNKNFGSGFKTPLQPSPLVKNPDISSVSKIPRGFSKMTVNNHEYTILKTLGRGGSSIVYQCFHNASKENRAIKCVTLDSLSSSEGYIKEIDVLKKLQRCDRIIKMFDHELVRHEKKLFVVLEIGSADLSQILRDLSKHEHVSSYLVLFYWMEMLYAVQQIHSHGIIHSDLKPANFLLVNGRLKLIDFGISSCVQNDRTSVTKTVSEGSSNYISPEALNCEYSTKVDSPNFGKPKYKISYKADVWSLGCILYQLIYKRTPFQHITQPMQKLMAIANPSAKIEYPVGNKISNKFIDTAKRCLNFNSKFRPSIDELILDYEIFCEM